MASPDCGKCGAPSRWKSREAILKDRLRGFDESKAIGKVCVPGLAAHQCEVIHNKVAADVAALVADSKNCNRNGSVGNGKVHA